MGAPENLPEAKPLKGPAAVQAASLQFDVQRGNVEANLAHVVAGLGEAAELGVDLVVLPEMWPTSFVDLQDFRTRWLPATEAALKRVRDLSRELKLMVAGSAFAMEGNQPDALPRNRLVIFDRGELIFRYDKVHLFSPTAEGESFSAGLLPPKTVETRLGKISGCLCYDLRFSALLRAPFLAAAEIIVVPAQWPEPRKSHWTALVQGRAVECQAFVVACNRTGVDQVGRRKLELEFPGNSFLVDPNGLVLAQGQGQAGLVRATLDFAELRHLRRRVPVRKDDLETLYRDWNPAEMT